MAPATVCLMYHELELPARPLCDSDPGYSRYAVSLESFREHMSFLKTSGMPGINISQMLSGVPGVALTFDDGSETDWISAAPLLTDFGFQATFYITLGFVGKRGFLSRQQARQLADAGFEIGCHSVSHPYLTDLDDAGLQREIVEARKQLQDMTGAAVDHFSCPGGRWNQRVLDVARQAGYKSVATSRIGFNRPGDSLFTLNRVAVTRSISLPEYKDLCRGKGLWIKGSRAWARQLMQRVMGNSAYDRVRAVLLKS